MPKLYFRHGAVSSAKTLNLLAVAHNYQVFLRVPRLKLCFKMMQVQGKAVMLLKPALDVRFGADSITSRAGLSKEVW